MQLGKFNNQKSSQHSNPLRLCIISCFPPSIGPLSEYTYYLVKHFIEDPTVSSITVLGDIIRTNDNELLLDKVTIKRCWNMNSIFILFDILNKLRSEKVDLVYFDLVFRNFSSNRIKNFIGLLTVFASKLMGKKVVVTLHSLAEATKIENVGYKNSIINRFGYKLITRLLLTADCVTMPHEHLVNMAKELYNAKNVVYVPHGVFNLPVEKFVFGQNKFLMFGKIGPYKGLETAVEAYKLLCGRKDDIGLLIAGSSHPLHPQYLEKIVNNYSYLSNIDVRGYVPEESLKDLFQSSVAVLLPYNVSVWTSSVFILACTYGRPVIASDLPDFKYLEQQGAGITLFPVNNVKALAEKMELILNDLDLQKRMGESNLRWARRHNFKEVSSRYLGIFNDVIKRSESI